MNTTNIFMSRFARLCYIIFCAVCAILAPSGYIQAETKIGYSVLSKDTVWDKAGSPYILSDYVTVPKGVTLIISRGVKVIKNPNYRSVGIDVIGGSLVMKGSGKDVDRVTVDGLWGIKILNGTANIANVDISSINSLNIENSVVNIATTTITKSSTPLSIKNSVVKVWGSRIVDNTRGIAIRPFGNPLMVMNENNEEYIGGIGNALEDGSTAPILTISNSAIVNNNGSSVLVNSSTSTVEARNNWWGNTDVSVIVSLNKISGLVDYTPWLINEPIFDPGKDEEEKVCCSSVMFLPGLEGSYLYKPESLPLGLGNLTNTLWIPNRNDDVRKLFLDVNGSSTDSSIYSGDPIASAFGLYGVYGKFMGFLDGLTKNGTVNEWKSFAYDWRKPIQEVVMGPEKKATTTEYLVKNIEDLASRSKTGKVTLIAHSNGGLVAKYLVKTLEELGKSNLIDSVISVAVPYLGTPQAIAGILHGDGQSLGYGILLSQAVSRQLGINMSSAYSLLPSTKYFTQIFTPTIAFASTSVIGANDGSYPKNITSGSDQASFINDLNNVRNIPDVSDTSLPIKGNKVLSIAADILHSILDPYSWPVNIARWAIVGWNTNTTKSVNYYEQTKCKKSPPPPSCITSLAHSASTTIMGDGTVVAKSASYEAGKVASIDLGEISSTENSNISHSNILESEAMQKTIEGIITGGNNDGKNTESFPLPSGVAWGEPDYSKDTANTELVISTHSPVELHIYDDRGNHTGTISNPTGEDIEEGLYTFFEEKIPNSRFKIQEENESESETYISLPDNGKKYSVIVKGTGVGEFTLDVERQKDGEVLDHVEYSALPVTPLMIASTSVTLIPFETFAASNSSNIASSSKPLNIDVDGNGSSDIQAKSGTDYLTASFDWVNYLEVLKKTISSLNVGVGKTKGLINRISKIEKMLEKGKLKQVRDLSKKLEKKIGHKKLKGLNDKDRQQILDMIDVFIAQYE